MVYTAKMYTFTYFEADKEDATLLFSLRFSAVLGPLSKRHTQAAREIRFVAAR
jgi:hypothetical protein